MERRRTEQIFSQYESQAAEKVEKMALDQGAFCESVRITLERDPMKEDFGQIKEISLILKAEEDGQKKEQKKEQRKEQGQIEPGGTGRSCPCRNGESGACFSRSKGSTGHSYTGNRRGEKRLGRSQGKGGRLLWIGRK